MKASIFAQQLVDELVEKIVEVVNEQVEEHGAAVQDKPNDWYDNEQAILKYALYNELAKRSKSIVDNMKKDLLKGFEPVEGTTTSLVKGIYSELAVEVKNAAQRTDVKRFENALRVEGVEPDIINRAASDAVTFNAPAKSVKVIDDAI